MIYVIILFLIVFYSISCFGAISYIVDRHIESNILSMLIVICPILNTYLAFKSCDLKDTINKLKGGEK